MGSTDTNDTALERGMKGEWVPIADALESVKAGGQVRRWGMEPSEILRVEPRADGFTYVFLDDQDVWRLERMPDGEWEVHLAPITGHVYRRRFKDDALPSHLASYKAWYGSPLEEAWIHETPLGREEVAAWDHLPEEQAPAILRNGLTELTGPWEPW